MTTAGTLTPRWEPLAEYHAGDIVLDNHDMPHGLDTQPGGHFRALTNLRSGYLNPRYVAADKPGEYWERTK
jgi:hypothetical protein